MAKECSCNMLSFVVMGLSSDMFGFVVMGLSCDMLGHVVVMFVSMKHVFMYVFARA